MMKNMPVTIRKESIFGGKFLKTNNFFFNNYMASNQFEMENNLLKIPKNLPNKPAIASEREEFETGLDEEKIARKVEDGRREGEIPREVGDSRREGEGSKEQGRYIDLEFSCQLIY